MKIQGNWLTKVGAGIFLGFLAFLGVKLTSLFVPAPYHYIGIAFPLIVLYLLGWIASKKD